MAHQLTKTILTRSNLTLRLQTARLLSTISQMERFKQSSQLRSLCNHLREQQIRQVRRPHQRVSRSLTNAIIAIRASIRIVNSVDTLQRLTLARARSSNKRSRKRKIVKKNGLRSRSRRSSSKSSQPLDSISKQNNRGEKKLQRSPSSYVSSTYKT